LKKGNIHNAAQLYPEWINTMHIFPDC